MDLSDIIRSLRGAGGSVADWQYKRRTKPRLSDDEAAALMNQSNEGFELANAGLNNALYGPDGTTGSVGASNITQTPSMLGAGEQGVPDTGIRNIHDYMGMPGVQGDEVHTSFPSLTENLAMVPETFTPSITMGTHPSKSIQEVGADEQMPDASKEISNPQGLGPNYGAHSWYDFTTSPALSDVGDMLPALPRGPTIEPSNELYPGHSQAARDTGASGILVLLSGRHGDFIDQNKAKMKEYGIPLSLGDKYSSTDWEELQRRKAQDWRNPNTGQQWTGQAWGNI